MTPINGMINDEELDNVAGGFLYVSQWVDYLSTQVMPVLYGLMNGASTNDRAILENICGTLRSTTIPGAEIANPIINLWANYNSYYRPTLQSNTIQVTLDQKLYSTKQYVETHR